jgi:hypothetical protein
MSDEIIKVSDEETLEWIGNLDEQSRVELKRRALERRAVEMLQPAPEAPDFASMSDQEFAQWKTKNRC